MVDINADGFLDIYVCNSGDVEGDNKQNELFINQGDMTFTEEATKYGLADPGYSTHASFFDYDKDGDLDVYLLNNSYQAIGSFDLRRNERPKRDKDGGDKLLENQNGKFVDVSEKAGIYGSVIGFGLGVTVGDVNSDGWEDIYVSNDFFERDYLYINNQDGTFSEELTNAISSISAASMGADMADIDNDGLLIFLLLKCCPPSMKGLSLLQPLKIGISINIMLIMDISINLLETLYNLIMVTILLVKSEDLLVLKHLTGVGELFF